MHFGKGRIHWPKRWGLKGKEADGSENATDESVGNGNNTVPEPDKSGTADEDVQTQDLDPPNLWQVAYESLDQDERSQLDLIRHEIPEKHCDNQHFEDPFISIWLQDTIKAVETQFEVRKAKEDASRIRRAAKGILDTACSMQSVVGSIAAADPTGHAASAWAVVSLGLTMTQNDRMLQNALFEASEFLTNILARYTLVEMILHKSHRNARISLEQSVIRLYANIMRYALEMTRVREMGVGKRIWGSLSVPDIASQELSTLRTSIENEDKNLHSLVDLDENIRNSQQGEMLLVRIEQNSALIQKIDQNFQLSKLPRAAKAVNGAWEDRHEELCFKDTREGLLQEIVDWVDDPHGTQFFWLNGMAGTGKSTISRTLAKFFQDRGILGASFFFKKGQEDCDSSKRFVPTIIYQLTKLLPVLKKDIQDVIEKNELIFDQGLEEQFNELFFNPIRSVRMPQRQILVLILDAVDECQNHQDIMQIFQLLLRTQSVKKLDLRFFITGRPEPAVINSFQNMESNRYREMVLQDIEGVERDISTYLHAKFSEIGAQPGVPASWPETTMQRLTEKANPLFIVASTICRFVGDEDFDPKERVELILQQLHSDNKLVQTYRTVLDQMILDKNETEKQEILGDFHRIVGSIVLLYDPLSATSLANLLEVRPDTIERRFRHLRSVLVIPNDEHTPIQPLHLSFRDILIDQSTSGMTPFKIDPIEQNQYLADQCLRVMSDHRTGLRRNMCNLTNEGCLRSEIHGIGQALSPELRYACRYWAKHLVDGKSVLDQDRIYTFFAEHFLHWLEAMSILGLVPEVSKQLKSIQKVFSETHHASITSFLADAIRFVQRAGYIMSIAPLQLYTSALIFTPEISIVREMFKDQFLEGFGTLRKFEKDWGALLQSSQGPDKPVRALEFSYDGRLHVCSFANDTVQLWDDEGMGSVQQVRTLCKSIDSPMSAFAFSPDGTLVACGFDDGSVQIWHVDKMDTVTLLPQIDRTAGFRALESPGNNRLVKIRDIAFSSNNNLIATLTWGEGLRLWDLTGSIPRMLSYALSDITGSVGFIDYDSYIIWSTIHGLKACSIREDGECSPDTTSITTMPISTSGDRVVFSRYSKRMVCSNWKDDVKIYDLNPSTAGDNLLPHRVISLSHRPLSFQLSPDDRWLACLFVHSIELFDLHCADSELRPMALNNLISRCSTMAFSRDSRRLACGLANGIVQQWDVHHIASDSLWQGWMSSPSSVGSVAISFDGLKLAVSSEDNDLCIWSIETNGSDMIMYTLPNDDRAYATCMVFSPDSAILATASQRTSTISIWDLSTKRIIRKLRGSNNRYIVSSMCFSSDSQTLISSSGDSEGHDYHQIWHLSKDLSDQPLELRGHSSNPIAVVFSPDDRCVVTSSNDNTISVWDPTTGEHLQQVKTTGPVYLLRFSADGHQILTERGAFRVVDKKFMETSPLTSPPKCPSVFAVRDGWIVKDTRRYLWLPPEYRGAWTCHKNVLYIGTKSGQVDKYVLDDHDRMWLYSRQCSNMGESVAWKEMDNHLS